MWDSRKSLIITEGPTDCAAGMDMGFLCVGRPSCSGGMHDVRGMVRKLRFENVVIISDNDSPGVNGAQMMARNAGVPACILTLPAKDLREFLKLGGTKNVLEYLIESSIWVNPSQQSGS